MNIKFSESAFANLNMTPEEIESLKADLIATHESGIMERRMKRPDLESLGKEGGYDDIRGVMQAVTGDIPENLQ